MDTKMATAAKVEEQRIASGMTRQHLSEASGIPYATLHRKLNGHSALTIDEIARLGSAMGVDPTTLLRFSGAAV